MLTNPKENISNVQVLKQTELCGRQFTVYGTAEEPLFKANEVASIIEHSTITKMLSLVDDEEKGVYKLSTPGGNQQVWFLTEDGLYEILMQSRKPIAKQFKKGVKEILKSIRRTGGYISTNPSDTPEEIMARALIVAQKTIEQGRQRIQMLESENESLTQENRALAPRAAYTDKVLQSASTYTFTQMAKELGFTSVNTLIRKLRDRHVIFRQSGQWLLMAKYSAHGYTATRTAHYFRADGTPDCSVSTVWTERGRAFLHTLLGEKGGDR